MLDQKRTQELLVEAYEDLGRYDELRANTQAWISTLEQRLRLLGADSKMVLLPNVVAENVMKPSSAVSKNGNGKSNTALYLEALAKSDKPLNAHEVWDYAFQRGARSDSASPDRPTDAILRHLVQQGKIVKVGPGRYAHKTQGGDL
jgi:hypothetical protein